MKRDHTYIFQIIVKTDKVVTGILITFEDVANLHVHVQLLNQ